MEIRTIQKNEFGELKKLVDVCFPDDLKKGGIFKRWPLGYRPDHAENNLVIKENNKLISHVGYVPQELVIGNVSVKIAGIGGVATDPDQRGRGLMKTMLEYCIEKMEKDNVPFSYLGGDRQRYANFGWEYAGREWVFTATPRSLKTSSRKIKSKVTKYSGSKSDLDFVKKLYENQPFRMKMDDAAYRLLFGRKGTGIYMANDGKNSSFVAIADDGKNRDVKAFAATGDASTMIDTLCALFNKNKELESIFIHAPFYHEKNSFLLQSSSYWAVVPNHMVKIINLKTLLEKFLPMIRKRAVQCKTGGEVTLDMGNGRQTASLMVEKGKTGISSAGTGSKLSLNELDMVGLLFGQGLLPSQQFKLGGKLKFLDEIFPLDFFLWPNDGI